MFFFSAHHQSKCQRGSTWLSLEKIQNYFYISNNPDCQKYLWSQYVLTSTAHDTGFLFIFYIKSSKISSLVRRKQNSEPSWRMRQNWKRRSPSPPHSRRRSRQDSRSWEENWVIYSALNNILSVPHTTQLRHIRRCVKVNVVEAKVDQPELQAADSSLTGALLPGGLASQRC